MNDDKTRERTRELPIVEMQQEEFKALQTQIATVTQQLSIAQAIAIKEKARSEELSNLVNRMQADFDNYRKRMNENNKKLKEDGICAVLEKLIPALDVLKQAIQSIPDAKVAEGVKMIYRQVFDILTAFNVEEIPALGEQFDPNLHNAIVNVKTNDPAQVNMIVEVFNKGFRLGDRVLRHSNVKVAN
ncbi:MAG: nucleotide exchange factor GrpE [Clostridiales bacterium]|nr:nucleotide exchange factor GrpE [Clostridiales bacterium]